MVVKTGNITFPANGGQQVSKSTLQEDLEDLNFQAGGSGEVVTKASLGLGSVDNTSDANKPVSIAVATALDTKLDDSQLDALLDRSIGLYGFTPTNCQKIRRGLARVAAGSAPFLIGMCGDSTFEGTGASPVVTQNVPGRLAAELVRAGFPARQDAIGFNNLDSRVSLGSGWSRQGNGAWINNDTTTSPLTLTPAGSVKDVVVTFIDAAAGSFTVQFDSETPITVTQSNIGALARSGVLSSATSGVKTIKIARVSGSININFVDIYNAGVKDIRVLNFGIGGTGVLAGGWWSSVADLTHVSAISACDAYVFNLGINDYAAQNPSNWAAQYQLMINFIKAASSAPDIILCFPTPSGGYLEAIQNTYLAALMTLATTNGLPLIDLRKRQGGSYNVANALGFMDDGLHPNNIGYADVARGLSAAILAA